MKDTQSNGLDSAVKTVRKFGIKNLTIVFVILVVIIFIASKMSGSRVSNIADTAKMGTLKMIDTAFKAQLQAGKLLPIPDGAVTIKIQDQILGYQGYVGSNVSSNLSFLGNKRIDPKTYTYFLDPTKTQYQLMTWITKETAAPSALTGSIAQTGENDIIVGALAGKEPYFLGSELGIFMEPYTHTPIQDVIKLSNRDLSSTAYPFIQQYTLSKITQISPWAMVETLSGLDSTFRDKLDTSKMNNLVGWRKFDEGSGNIVHDSSRYGNNGVITGNGISWVVSNGRPGLQFAGSGWVEIPESASLDLTDSFTIVVEFEQLGDQQGTLISKDGVGTDSSRAYNVYASKNVRYEVNNHDSIAGGLISTGEISKIVLNYQNGKLSMRQDSKEVIDSKDIITPKALTTDLLFGRRGLESSSYLNGILYAIRIYK